MEQIFQVKIEKIGINGEGVAYYNKKTVFVTGALPGELVKVKVENETEKIINASIEQIINKSPKRIMPLCKHYGKCGGCTLQHLDYNETLVQKRNLVIESISKYTKLNPYSFEIKATIGMDEPYHYRNKSALPVRFEKKTVLGIYMPMSNILVPITNCLIQREILNKINNEIALLMDKYKILPFDKKIKKGLVRYVVVRECINTNEAQVTIVLQNDKGNLDDFLKEVSMVEGVTSLYTDINSDINSNEIFGNKLKKRFGSATIKEKLGKYVYSLLPNAFFQLNPIQTVKLYDEIKKASRLSRQEIVLDAYCGAGTIGIWISNMAKEVIGIETNSESIISAKHNAINNKIKNISFIEGDVTAEYKKLIIDKRVDVVLLDPPRTGLGKEMCNLLNETKPKRIVYTSCNPSTLAKDINILDECYQVKYIQPIDMFPQTSHVESVCLLELKAIK